MVSLKLQELEIVVFGYVCSILQRQQAQTCSELAYLVQGSFKYARFLTAVNIKSLAPDRINLRRTRSSRSTIPRSLYHILFYERCFFKWSLLSKLPIQPGSIIVKFTGT